jgi:uncharacterized protein
MSSNDVSTVRGAYEAFGRGDIPGVMSMLAESVEWRAPDVLPHGGAFSGRSGVGAFFQGIGEKWETLQVEPTRFLDAGGDVVVLGRASGTLRGAGPAEYGFAHVFTLNDGMVTGFGEYVDPGDAIVATKQR